MTLKAEILTVLKVADAPLTALEVLFQLGDAVTAPQVATALWGIGKEGLAEEAAPREQAEGRALKTWRITEAGRAVLSGEPQAGRAQRGGGEPREEGRRQKEEGRRSEEKGRKAHSPRAQSAAPACSFARGERGRQARVEDAAGEGGCTSAGTHRRYAALGARLRRRVPAAGDRDRDPAPGGPRAGGVRARAG